MRRAETGVAGRERDHMRFTFASLLLLTAIQCRAQEFRSTLSGIVTDSQGAVIAGAKLAAKQKETGAEFQTVSGQDGQYTLPFLPPGDFVLSVEATGFKRFVREGIRVSTNQRIALDVSMEVGAVTENVTITAEAPLLETSTASSGQVIGTQVIENMPMNGRTPLVLAQLAFGVIPSSDPRFFRPFDNGGPSGFSMGGAVARSNELLLDGAPNTTRDNRVAYNPPVDAVQEVKVETFNIDAAYGHTGGGTVNVVMKGGTNQLHGTAYEFNQISNLAANQFFNNATNQPRPLVRFNQYGATVGGPIFVPKLVDGRNRLFFFFGFEQVKDALPRPERSTVPTEAFRSGNLSQLLNVASIYQIYDPATGVREGDRVRRQPFPGNIIPANRISAIARNYMAFYPQPNAPGQPNTQDNLFIGQAGERNAFFNYLGRTDINISDRNKLFFSMRTNDRAAGGIGSLGFQVGQNAAGGRRFKRENWGATLDDVHTINPSTVLNVRLNWTRFIEGNTNLFPDFDTTALGLPAYIRNNTRQSTLPRVVFPAASFTSLGTPASEQTAYDIFQIFTSMTKIVRSHTLKFGADLRHSRESGYALGDSSGRYDFGTEWTRGPLDSSPSAPLGQDFAAFLLGLPTAGQFDLNAFRTVDAKYFAFFLQDDWRVKRNLTLNLGLRAERDVPPTERYNRAVNGFDFTTANPIQPAVVAAYARNPIPEIAPGQFQTPGGLLFASSGNSRIFDTNPVYFSPRVGISWSPEALGGKTVLRAGIGSFLFSYGVPAIQQPGFSQETLLVPTLDGFLTPSATFANPFPNGFDQPPGSSRGLATFNGRGVRYTVPALKNPYSLRWNFSVQRQLSAGLLFEAGYIGNRSVHLEVTRDIGALPGQWLSTTGARDQAIINRNLANVSNPFAGLLPRTGLNGGVVARQQLLRPFPQFLSVTQDSNNRGSSTFHMLMLRLEKRFSNGVNLMANYQYSKLIEWRSHLNAFSEVLEKRIASEDRPQRLVVSSSLELPFGKGKRFAASLHPVVNGVIGGWVSNVIYTWQPGGPVDWGNVIYLGGPLNWDPRRVDGVFDTRRFNTIAAQQLDFNVRTFPTRFATLRADGANNVDFSMLKNFKVKERLTIQFRAEFFNFFNTPTFNAPNLSPTAANFGRITGQANIARRTQLALRLIW
jgi:hypothetical protein